MTQSPPRKAFEKLIRNSTFIIIKKKFFCLIETGILKKNILTFSCLSEQKLKHNQSTSSISTMKIQDPVLSDQGFVIQPPG